MIVLFTDFGIKDHYVGQLHAAIYAVNPTAPVVDLFHHAPVFDVQAGSILLEAFIEPISAPFICVGVVDPGVGSSRVPVLITAGENIYIGPNNGLFSHVTAEKDIEIFELEEPRNISVSFHGRDLFANVAARYSLGLEIKKKRIPYEVAQQLNQNDYLERIIYQDRFGNLMTGVKKGALRKSALLKLGGLTIKHARVFSDVPEGELFWYENSVGLVEIEANKASAAVIANVRVGSEIIVLPGS
ncbi:MAG: SAM hydrolase/SAM-dependent halogenase family protein [Thiotrichales bacterium]